MGLSLYFRPEAPVEVRPAGGDPRGGVWAARHRRGGRAPPGDLSQVSGGELRADPHKRLPPFRLLQVPLVTLFLTKIWNLYSNILILYRTVLFLVLRSFVLFNFFVGAALDMFSHRAADLDP